jgi:fructose-1,6-bisphosphatase
MAIAGSTQKLGLIPVRLCPIYLLIDAAKRQASSAFPSIIDIKNQVIHSRFILISYPLD